MKKIKMKGGILSYKLIGYSKASDTLRLRDPHTSETFEVKGAKQILKQTGYKIHVSKSVQE